MREVVALFERGETQDASLPLTVVVGVGVVGGVLGWLEIRPTEWVCLRF